MRRSTSARSVGFARSTSAIAAGEIPPTYKDCPASATRENFVRRREETGPSEQRDADRCALLDSVDVRGNLDVSVRVRHRCDRAALLERRDRGPVRDSNGMEFEPSPNPLDWVSEGDLDRPWRCRREMRHPSEHRPQEHVAVRQAGGWISGHDEDRLPVDVAQGGRLAGFDRNPVEQDFAEGPDDVDDEVPFPRGRPAREDDEVVVESPTERRPNGGRSIGHPSEEDWLAAILARHGRHRVRVDVIDLSRLDPLTWRDELVARGQDRNRWPHECLELRPSDRREDSDLRGRHLLSRAHDDGSAADVRSAPHDILTHAHGSENLHGLAVRSVSSTRTTAVAPGGIVDPVATSAQLPDVTRLRGTSCAWSVAIRTRAAGRVSLASFVSSARTAYPSIAERSARGTSIVDRTSSAATRCKASGSGTASVRRRGRTKSLAMRWASSKEMSPFNGRIPCRT